MGRTKNEVPTFEQFLAEIGELPIDDEDVVDSAPSPLPVCAAIARATRRAYGAPARRRREREIEIEIEVGVVAEVAIEVAPADDAVPPSPRAA